MTFFDVGNTGASFTKTTPQALSRSRSWLIAGGTFSILIELLALRFPLGG